MMTSSNGNIFRVTPFVRGNHQSPVNFPHNGQWRGAFMFSLICAWLNRWVNNSGAGDLRRHRARPLWRHCNDTVKPTAHNRSTTQQCSTVCINLWMQYASIPSSNKRTHTARMTVRQIKTIVNSNSSNIPMSYISHKSISSVLSISNINIIQATCKESPHLINKIRFTCKMCFIFIFHIDISTINVIGRRSRHGTQAFFHIFVFIHSLLSG